MRSILFGVLALVLLLGPSLADAKAGGGGSVGSRGAKTYQSMPSGSVYRAAPIQKSMTPPPVSRAAPAMNAPMASVPQTPSFFGAHPFLTSLAGGFLGASLADMFFGHSAGAAVAGGAGAADPVGGAIGSILQLLLFGGLIYLVVRWFRSQGSVAPMGRMQPMGFAAQAPVLEGVATAVNNDGMPLVLGPQDYQAFQDLLVKIQTSWGAGDLTHLRQYLTPEMMSYFNEELSRAASQGLVNKIDQVRLLAGDLIEAWSEDALEYATVYMKWSAVDYMARLDRGPSDADYVVSGSATQPEEQQEIWTFARARGGVNAHWVLSAVQQVG